MSWGEKSCAKWYAAYVEHRDCGQKMELGTCNRDCPGYVQSEGLLAANAELRAELEGIKARHEAVLKELPADEEHCGCAVVMFKEVQRLKAKLEVAEKREKELESALPKFKDIIGLYADDGKVLVEREKLEGIYRLVRFHGEGDNIVCAINMLRKLLLVLENEP